MAKNDYRDPKGAHVRIYKDLLDSPAWAALSWTGRSLFLDLRSRLGRNNNGNISAALSLMREKGWRSSSTLADALFELQALGFIAKTRDTVGVENGSRVCCLYRFTDLQTYEFPKLHVAAHPETHEYRKYRTLAAAEQALREAEALRKAKGQEKPSVRKAKPARLLSESTSAARDSVSEHRTTETVRTLNAG